MGNIYKPNSRKLKSSNKFWDYTLMFILFSISGCIWTIPIQGKFYFLFFIGFIYYLFSKKNEDWRSIFLFAAFLIIIFFLQYQFLGYIGVKESIGVILRLFVGYFIVLKLGSKFKSSYFNLMYFFSLVSIIFFLVLLLFNVAFDVIGYPNYSNIIIWNCRSIYGQYELRNCGPFWEPSAFAGYLLLIPLFYFDDISSFIRINRRKLVIILIAFILTFSTTGYLAGFILLFLFFLLKRKQRLIHLIISIPLIVVIFWAIFKKVDFLGNKILVQTEDALNKQGVEFTNTRLGSFLFDLQYVKKHPAIGNGLIPETRYADHPDLIWQIKEEGNLGHGNGFISFIVMFGIPALLYWCILFIKKWGRYYKRPQVYSILLILLILLQSESYFNYPLFFILPFIILKENAGSFK